MAYTANMNEYNLERKDDIPSTSSLSKLGITAIGYTAGGIFLFLLQAFARLRGLGLVAGAVVCVVGIVSLMSKDTADKKAGAIITSAGVLVLLSKIPGIAPAAATLLSIGGIGLLAMGIINGIKFLIGLKKRS
jgi:hypothetical protein